MKVYKFHQICSEGMDLIAEYESCKNPQTMYDNVLPVSNASFPRAKVAQSHFGLLYLSRKETSG